MARMRVGIVGGRLQGIEAAYLCSKAAFETVLVDSDSNAPAKDLADEFHEVDIVRKPERAKHVLQTCDAVIPANENRRALVTLHRICDQLHIPFMQDYAAFSITSDKKESMKFFRKWAIPTPKAWPGSGFPVIVKPSRKSGSESVYRADDKHGLKETLKIVRAVDSTPIVQEFIEGRALSLEVISKKGSGQPLQITGLEFDQRYGCKRVYAPAKIPSEVDKKLNVIGVEIASKLGLNGLIDVQALLQGSTPRVNEINARLPSQTPSVVYHSAKINMAELLIELFVDDRLVPMKVRSDRAVIYQHVKVLREELRVQGESVMADASGLRVEKDFLGADEAITNLKLGADARNRVATLIVESHDLSTASKKMKEVVRNIMNEYHLNRYTDPSPRRGSIS